MSNCLGHWRGRYSYDHLYHHVKTKRLKKKYGALNRNRPKILPIGDCCGVLDSFGSQELLNRVKAIAALVDRLSLP